MAWWYEEELDQLRAELQKTTQQNKVLLQEIAVQREIIMTYMEECSRLRQQIDELRKIATEWVNNERQSGKPH
jgi:predicted RNase H-like nuclease (RuvC/YqgF family)